MMAVLLEAASQTSAGSKIHDARAKYRRGALELTRDGVEPPLRADRRAGDDPRVVERRVSRHRVAALREPETQPRIQNLVRARVPSVLEDQPSRTCAAFGFDYDIIQRERLTKEFGGAALHAPRGDVGRVPRADRSATECRPRVAETRGSPPERVRPVRAPSDRRRPEAYCDRRPRLADVE